MRNYCRHTIFFAKNEITFFEYKYLQRMYVITYIDLPDTIVFTYKEMESKIIELGCQSVYEYKMEETGWVIKRKYTYLEGISCVNAGDWNVPPQYYTYGDPNSCSCCKRSRYMQGNYCMLCNSCHECGMIEIECIC